MIDLDAATVLLQWAAGGLFFLWVTSRRREVGIGYGWMMRTTFGLIAAGGVAAGLALDPVPVREVAGAGMVTATAVALVISVLRRRAGVAGQRGVEERRTTRVAEMTGIDRDRRTFDDSVSEFPPALDLVAPALGLIALVAGGLDAGDPALLAVARTLVGALFLGAVTDAMLLGHWYLVQPGLARGPLLELVRWTGVVAVRVGCLAMADRYGLSTEWHHRRRLQRPSGLVLGGVLGDLHRTGGPDPGGPPGTPVFGRHGGYRPSLPGHPHCLWHGPGGPGHAGLRPGHPAGDDVTPQIGKQ